METQWGWVGGRRTKGTIRPHCTEAVVRAFECRRTQRGLASACNHTTIFNRSVLSEDIPPSFFSCAFYPELSLKTVSIYFPWHLCQESVFDSLLSKIHTSFESKRRRKKQIWKKTFYPGFFALNCRKKSVLPCTCIPKSSKIVSQLNFDRKSNVQIDKKRKLCGKSWSSAQFVWLTRKKNPVK